MNVILHCMRMNKKTTNPNRSDSFTVMWNGISNRFRAYQFECKQKECHKMERTRPFVVQYDRWSGHWLNWILIFCVWMCVFFPILCWNTTQSAKALSIQSKRIKMPCQLCYLSVYCACKPMPQCDDIFIRMRFFSSVRLQKTEKRSIQFDVRSLPFWI